LKPFPQGVHSGTGEGSCHGPNRGWLGLRDLNATKRANHDDQQNGLNILIEKGADADRPARTACSSFWACIRAICRNQSPRRTAPFSHLSDPGARRAITSVFGANARGAHGYSRQSEYRGGTLRRQTRRGRPSTNQLARGPTANMVKGRRTTTPAPQDYSRSTPSSEPGSGVSRANGALCERRQSYLRVFCCHRSLYRPDRGISPRTKTVSWLSCNGGANIGHLASERMGDRRRQGGMSCAVERLPAATSPQHRREPCGCPSIVMCSA
jgi:hypothetical protein